MEGVAQVALPHNISWVGVGGTSLQGVYRHARPKVYASVRNGIVRLTILVSNRIWFLHSSSELGMFFWKKLLYSLTDRSKTRH